MFSKKKLLVTVLKKLKGQCFSLFSEKSQKNGKNNLIKISIIFQLL